MQTAREIIRRSTHGYLFTAAPGASLPILVRCGATMRGVPLVLGHRPASSPAILVLGPDASGTGLVIEGTIEEPDPADQARLRRRFGLGESDAGAWRLAPTRASLLDLATGRCELGVGELVLTIPATPATSEGVNPPPSVAANEDEIVQHMNDDHPDILELLAVKVLGEQPGAWRLSGADPEGLDLGLAGRIRRLSFGEPAWDFQALRRQLKGLAGMGQG